MTEKVKVTLYTDGACSGNPGKGGYGTILVAKDDNGVEHKKELYDDGIITTDKLLPPQIDYLKHKKQYEVNFEEEDFG